MIFSVIIPTNNSDKNISYAIKSVLDQSYQDFEILIIDNLSSDRTIECVNSFQDSRIKVFLERDNGVYDALNKGIKKSTGDWLYFLGSDDTFYNDQVLTNVFRYILGTSAKVLYGDCKIIGDTGWARNGDIYDGEFDFEKLIKKNICHQSIFYHKSVFKRIGFYDVEYKVCADWDFNLRALANFSFEYVDLVIAKFSAGGLSSNQQVIMDRFIFRDYAPNISKYYRIPLSDKIFLGHTDGMLNFAVYSIFKANFILTFRTLISVILLEKSFARTLLIFFRKIKTSINSNS